MSLKKNKYLVLPLVILLTGLYLCPLRIFGPGLSFVPGDLGDARFNNYILEHDYRYFTGAVDHYWDAPLLYPFKNTIAFSDNLLGTAPLYALFRITGNDRETAFQLWLLVLFALNFVCCYWALMKWSKENVLASAGAYIFAFSILLVGNIYNVQTIPRFVVPLVFYWLWKYFNQKELKYFAYLVFGIVYQFYCGIYLGFLLLYALIFFAIAYFIVYRDFSLFKEFKNKKPWIHHGLVLLLAGAVFYPLIHPYMEISKVIAPPLFEEVLPTIPTWRSYFFTSKAPVFWNILSEHGVVIQWFWCHYLFIGAMPWIAVILIPFILLSKRTGSSAKKFISFLGLGLFMCLICCLNIEEFSIYRFFYQIPGFSSMRSMNRVINTEVFFFILVLVFVFNEIRNYSRIMKVIVWCIPLLVVLDNLINPAEIIRYTKKDAQNRIVVLKQELEAKYDKKHVAIAYMLDSTKNVDMIALHLDVMLATQELGIACVNGYSGHHPGEYNQFFEQTSIEALTKWCAYNQVNPAIIQQIKR